MNAPRRQRYRLRTLQDLFRLPPELVPGLCKQLSDAVQLWQRTANPSEGFPVELTFFPDGIAKVELEVVSTLRRADGE